MEFILRKWQPEDARDLAEAADNPKIAGNLRNVFPNPYRLEDAEWFINDCISKGDEAQSLQITRAIVVDGKAAGGIGITVKDDVFAKSAELGYWLCEDYWRQGITSRAVKMICKEAFEKFDIVVHIGVGRGYNFNNPIGCAVAAAVVYFGFIANNGKIRLNIIFIIPV